MAKTKQKISSGKLDGIRKLNKEMKQARKYIHLYEKGWSELRCNACGLSESNPIHDFREPPGVGAI